MQPIKKKLVVLVAVVLGKMSVKQIENVSEISEFYRFLLINDVCSNVMV